jgi:peptide/nickel transport system substrate-binding protein
MLFIFSPAYGQEIISIQTDKNSYTLKEYVVVTGQVSNYNPGEGKTVRIDVFDSEDKVFTGAAGDPCCLKVISGEEVEPSDDGSYSYRFYIPNNEGVKFGQYAAQATYDGKSVETAFEVTSTHVSTTSGQDTLSVQTDKVSHVLKEYVVVTGQVSNYNPGEGKTVRIDVFDSEDKVFTGAAGEGYDPCCLKVISGEEVEPSDDGSYSYRFFIPISSLMPDRINEFKQGLYTAQATYDGKSVETTFRISETLGVPEDLGGAIESPLIFTDNFSPPRMVPGRIANQVLELKNYGTAEGHFLVLVGFAQAIQYDLAGIIYPFGESEVIYSNEDVIVISASLKPQEIKLVSIPIRIPPDVVQFERQTPLQEGKLLVVDDRFITAVTVDIATISLADWVLLKQEFGGTDLFNQAIAKSSEADESFIDKIDSLKAAECQGVGSTSAECANAVLGETRDVAPALAAYVESIIIEPPDGIDIRVSAGSLAASEGTNPELIETSMNEMQDSLLPLAYAQQPSGNQTGVQKPHVCPNCNDGPSKLTISDHGVDAMKVHEGYAGLLSKCNTKEKECSIDGKSSTNYGFYNDKPGYCTTGYGHLVAKKSCQAIDKEDANSANRKAKDAVDWIKTEDDAKKQFKDDLPVYEKAVNDNVKVPLCQAQFDALVSFVFNLGEPNFKSSTLLKKLNNKDYDGASKEFAKWNKAAGKVVKGLTDRRADEANMFKSCEPGSCTDVKSSMDPNHLYADPDGYMRGDSHVLFTAMFENLANATAPAFDVKVVTSIDKNFDIDTLSSLTVSHPNRLQNFTLDKSNREAAWYFKDIELPPNTSPPQGEGWIKYSVQPIADLPTDSAMTSQARIFFDFNPPIDTNVVEHKIDRDIPSTKVKALPSETATNSFDIEWEASDQGSGIYHQTIRVSRDSDFGSYEILDTSGAVNNKMQFSGEPDQKYSFVSVAVDNVGNVETKSVADTSTTIKQQSQSQCLIATAAFGSELSPQVGFLRNFRDNHILSTAAGSSFMNVFNTWYYSFSPYVANYERDQPWLQQTVKTAIYPLLGILTLAEKAYSAMPGEYGSVAAGLVASSLIGAVYFTPFAFSSKQIRIGKSTSNGYKLVLIALAAGTTAAALMIIVFPLANPINLMISTSVLVIATLALTSILTASLVAKVAKKLSILLSRMFSARKRTT